MSANDLIASPTLAHLYISQGHRRRAREVLDDVLARDASDGHAQHLRWRLDTIEPGEIALQLTGGRLRATWKRARTPEGCHVVLYALRRAKDGLLTWVTSAAVEGTLGSVDFAIPFPRGSATACMGRLVGDRGFVPHCVGDPVVWTEESA